MESSGAVVPIPPAERNILQQPATGLQPGSAGIRRSVSDVAANEPGWIAWAGGKTWAPAGSRAPLNLHPQGSTTRRQGMGER